MLCAAFVCVFVFACMRRSDIYIFVAAFSAQKLESAHFSLRTSMVRCFLTACLLLPCFSSSALIGPNRVVSGQSRLLPDGGESLSSKNSFPTNASGRPVSTGLCQQGSTTLLRLSTALRARTHACSHLHVSLRVRTVTALVIAKCLPCCHVLFSSLLWGCSAVRFAL